MCGIGGVLVKNGVNLDVRDLDLMSSALAHRGPDGEGKWVSPDRVAGFVHRRLAILDTSDLGHQPMHSADGKYTIVFNGEIFNFIEIQEELLKLGSVFHSNSDTEVILEAWRHWGKSMLLRFNGMWAFAIRNNINGEVILARDRFGIKPLLYTQSEERFAFASEMRTLLTLPWINRQVDVEVISRLVLDPFTIEAGERTLHASIRRLPAGHLATVLDGIIIIERWWRTTDHLVATPSLSDQQADRFRDIFFNAVKLRMRSDVPLTTCLSGGFDSSAIACAMNIVSENKSQHLRETKDWRHAFIASFPGALNDETPQALEAAAYANVTPHVLEITNNDALSFIEKVLEDFDDVYISLPTAPWQIYRELRRSGMTVSLDGHGADELMGAYHQGGEIFGYGLRNMLSNAVSRSKFMGHLLDLGRTLYLTLKGYNFVRSHRFSVPTSIPTPFDNDQLPTYWGGLNRRLYRMFHATLLPTILRNFDRLSMAHGVEVRMPFMDWRLVTYVMSLPDSAKVDGGISKLVARNAMKNNMPESIRSNKNKIGFNSPMPEWMNGPLCDWVFGVLDMPNDSFDKIIDTKSLRKKVSSLNETQSWNWENVGRLWPYIHLKWYLDNHNNSSKE